jgi:hypothetical protein
MNPSGLLTTQQLERIATFVGDSFFEAYRGALPHESGRSVIVFGNDGYGKDGRVLASIAKAKASLEGDGCSTGPVVADPEVSYSWCFEVVPPDGIGLDVALSDCESAVWEGWIAAREDSGEAISGEVLLYASAQRTEARTATAGAIVPAAT